VAVQRAPRVAEPDGEGAVADAAADVGLHAALRRAPRLQPVQSQALVHHLWRRSLVSQQMHSRHAGKLLSTRWPHCRFTEQFDRALWGTIKLLAMAALPSSLAPRFPQSESTWRTLRCHGSCERSHHVAGDEGPAQDHAGVHDHRAVAAAGVEGQALVVLEAQELVVFR